MTNNTTTELLPCPFCGGDPILNEIEPHDHKLMLNGIPIMPDYPGSWTIECCDVGMIKDTREEVVTAWNRRTVAHEAPSLYAGQLNNNCPSAYASQTDRSAAHGEPSKDYGSPLDFSKPLETIDGRPVEYIGDNVIEYGCARVCVDPATGIVYSSPHHGLRIRNVCEAGSANMFTQSTRSENVFKNSAEMSISAGDAEQVSEREAFEEFAGSLELDLQRAPSYGDDLIYSDCNTDYAWLAWQAAIARSREYDRGFSAACKLHGDIQSAPERKALTKEKINAIIKKCTAAMPRNDGDGTYYVDVFDKHQFACMLLAAQASAQSTDDIPTPATLNSMESAIAIVQAALDAAAKAAAPFDGWPERCVNAIRAIDPQQIIDEVSK